MDAKRREIHGDIIRIKRVLENRQKRRVQNRRREKLGIRVTAVPFTANKFPQFKPCFFVPRGLQLVDIQSSSNPAEHDLEEGGEGKGLQLLKDQTEMIPDSVQFPPILSTVHANKLNTLKHGGFNLSDNTSLSRLGPLSKGKWPFSPESRLSEHRFRQNKWQISLCLEDTTYTVPHAIIDVLVDTKYPVGGLTEAEAKAIIRVMEIRMIFPSYQDHLILPLLVLSYLGPEHARILQAHHDGNRMIIQYSDTVHLDDMSVRNFLGYYCSEPVGVTIPK